MGEQNMMVDPQELVIDLPLSEANVIQKMESLAVHGMIQPVTVWLQDNRLIDGFHRTEAARRLGWTALHVFVKDCDEEGFWDARIQSARQHHEIEADRLTAWMFECWKQTKWYIPLAPDEKGLMPRAYVSSGIDLRLVEMVWTVFRKKGIAGYSVGLDSLTDEEGEVHRWVDLRARQWGIHSFSLAEKLLQAFGIRPLGGAMGDTYDQWARHYNLTLKQQLRVQREIPREPGKYSQPSMEMSEDFIREKIIPGIEDDEGIYEFRERKFRERMERERGKSKRGAMLNLLLCAKTRITKLTNNARHKRNSFVALPRISERRERG